MRATSPKMPTLVPRGRLSSTPNTSNSTNMNNTNTNSVMSMRSLFAPGSEVGHPVSIASYHRNGFSIRTKPKQNYIKQNKITSKTK